MEFQREQEGERILTTPIFRQMLRGLWELDRRGILQFRTMKLSICLLAFLFGLVSTASSQEVQSREAEVLNQIERLESHLNRTLSRLQAANTAIRHAKEIEDSLHKGSEIVLAIEQEMILLEEEMSRTVTLVSGLRRKVENNKLSDGELEEISRQISTLVELFFVRDSPIENFLNALEDFENKNLTSNST